MKCTREVLPAVADSERYQQALLAYNQALLDFHTLPEDADPDQREAARLAFGLIAAPREWERTGG